jgi:hypothetical protein
MSTALPWTGLSSATIFCPVSASVFASFANCAC